MLTLGRRKMNHIAVRLEHIDLLDRLDGLDVHLLERRLQLLVVGSAALVDLLHLSSRSSFAAVESNYQGLCWEENLE